MPFDDLDDQDDQGTESLGDEALDELAGTLSGRDDGGGEDDKDDREDDKYDVESEPAFPTLKKRTQHSVYCLPRTWNAVDGASGLLFEAEVALRRDGYGAVQKRELHNAFLQAAVNELSAEDVADAFVETRRERSDGPLLEE